MSQTQPQVIAMKIHNVGDYVGTLYLGSEQTPVTVTLDTGSSTLAVDQQYYNPTTDTDAEKTDLTQNVSYGSGSWSGQVVQTTVTLESSAINASSSSSKAGASLPSGSVSLPKVDVSVAATQRDMFSSEANGILGLAYQPLDTAEETQTGKWRRKAVTIEPFFTQLEQAGVTTNMFSFYTLRSTPSLESSDSKTNPLNGGWLILGGGREMTQLFEGTTFQEALILDDLYYNVNLTSIQVGSSPPIPVSLPNHSSPSSSNCIVDSGTNGLVFPSSAYQDVQAQFSESQQQVIKQALSHGGTYPQSELDLSQWPAITVTLAGVQGDVTLDIQPDTYWQLYAELDVASRSYNASLRFFGAAQQAILGLPLMNNYYCVFDRSANKGKGVIAFAPIKPPTSTP